jgi:GNAT superfamily N-acetyltransferase
MSDTIELGTVDSFPEPAFTELVERVLHDPDRRAVAQRLYVPAAIRPTPTGAQQVRIGAYSGDLLVGWSHAFLQHGGVMYVGNSGVVDEHRRQGIYTRLIDAMEQEARKLGCVRIESHHRTANSSVLIAKLKAGYTIVGTEFSPNMGLLVKMCKFLDASHDAVFHARSGIVESTVRFLASP